MTARKDSADILNFLEHAGLFVVPIDAEHRWYRYHHLFADVLRKMLEQMEPDQARELHRRAAFWFADNQLIPEAISHALAVCDDSRAASLIEQVGMELLWRGEVTTLLNWLGALPVEQIHARPRLCLYYASALMTAGQFDTVPPLLQAAELNLSADKAGSEIGALMSLLTVIQATFAARYGKDEDKQNLNVELVAPAGGAKFTVWTAERLSERAASDNPDKNAPPIGQGTKTSYRDGNQTLDRDNGYLTWSGDASYGGTFYIVVESTSSVPIQYALNTGVSQR